MEDSIIVKYADHDPLRRTGSVIEFTGTRVSDTDYPDIGLHEQAWINKEKKYSITISVRMLPDRVLENININ